MAITNFISTVWSETLLKKLDHEYIGVKNCSRDYEGEIRGKGSSVKICGIGDITVSDYTKNTDLATPQTLSDNVRTLIIDKAKAFNFQIDDIDRAQSNPKIMELAMSHAARALADVADKYVYTLYSELTTSGVIKVDSFTAENAIDTIINARQTLLNKGVNSNIPACIEVSPAIAAVILKAKILKETDNTETMSNGYLGNLIGFEIYVSPNIVVDTLYHKCFVRTKRAITFAEQLNEVEAYRPESRFADAVKGLHLYGAKVVYPDEFLMLNLKV